MYTRRVFFINITRRNLLMALYVTQATDRRGGRVGLKDLSIIKKGHSRSQDIKVSYYVSNHDRLIVTKLDLPLCE